MGSSSALQASQPPGVRADPALQHVLTCSPVVCFVAAELILHSMGSEPISILGADACMRSLHLQCGLACAHSLPQLLGSSEAGHLLLPQHVRTGSASTWHGQPVWAESQPFAAAPVPGQAWRQQLHKCQQQK